MIAIIDIRSHKKAIDELSKYVDDILLFESHNITYNSISCHPDIFIYQNNIVNIIAPNSPIILFDFFEKHNINFKIGNSLIGKELYNTVNYNCLTTNLYFFHNLNYTDKLIKNLNNSKIQINLNQAYTACSLIALNDNLFITSDKGIQTTLLKNNLNSLYFSPEKIKIFDHKHGFIGGCAGFANNKLFFNGNIEMHDDSKKLRTLCENQNIEIICLHNDYLYDGGKILFF